MPIMVCFWFQARQRIGFLALSTCDHVCFWICASDRSSSKEQEPTCKTLKRSSQMMQVPSKLLDITRPMPVKYTSPVTAPLCPFMIATGWEECEVVLHTYIWGLCAATKIWLCSLDTATHVTVSWCAAGNSFTICMLMATLLSHIVYPKNQGRVVLAAVRYRSITDRACCSNSQMTCQEAGAALARLPGVSYLGTQSE